MRLLLESLVCWGEKYPQNSKKEPTRFKKALNHLVKENVLLPASHEFKFYRTVDNKAAEKSHTPQPNPYARDDPPVGKSKLVGSKAGSSKSPSESHETPGGPTPGGGGNEHKGKYGK